MIGGAVELMLVILASSTLMLAFTPLSRTLQNWTFGANAAWEQRMIWNAADEYIRRQWATAYANAASPMVLPLSTLQSLGYLPVNFGGPNPWRQTPVIVLAQAGANQLVGYVATIGGNPIPVNVLSKVASWTGDYAAYVPYASEPFNCSPGPCAKIVGNFGQISLAAYGGLGAVPTAGHLVNGLFYNAGQAVRPFLYRIQQPGAAGEDSKMYQAINMNGNDIDAAVNINATVRMTAPVFADSGNPGSYYLQPAGSSQIQDLRLRNLTGSGNATVAGSMTAGAFLYPP